MDPSVIKETQAALGPFLSKPILTEKFLQKPPVRFLHDVICEAADRGKLMQTLLDNDERLWTDVVANDKDAKLFFFAKIINYLSVASKRSIDAVPQKICAGQEPEKTNLMLQTLGQLLTSGKVDDKSVTATVKSGAGPVELKTFSKSKPFFTSGQPATTAKDPASTSKPSTPASAAAVKAKPAGQSIDPTASKDKVLTTKTAPPSAETKAGVNKGAASAKTPLKPKPGAVPSAPTGSAASNTKASKLGTENAGPVDIKPTQRPPSARPVTGRAPIRPATATIRAADGTEVEQPPPNVHFLTEDTKDEDDELDDLLQPSNLDSIIHPLGELENDEGKSGLLVENLKRTKDTLLDEFGAESEEPTTGSNPLVEQELNKFTSQVDDLRNSLQKVSRLTDVMTNLIELLPEDLEDMEKDRQRYSAEFAALQQQLTEAQRAEDVQLEKLRRNLALSEEMLFKVTEEIASAHHRIREKSDVLIKLQQLQ